MKAGRVLCWGAPGEEDRTDRVIILHLSYSHIPSDARILKEMRTLACLEGVSIHGLGVEQTCAAKASVPDERISVEVVRLRTVRCAWLPHFIRHALGVVELTLRFFCRAIRLRPRIIHVHDTYPLPVAVLLKIFARADIIYDAHELESDRSGLSRAESTATYIVERCLWHFVRAYITVSPSIDAWYRSTLGEKTSAVVLNTPSLPPSNVTSAVVRGADCLRTRFGIPEEAWIFMYVGLLDEGRGIELYLDVFEGMDRAHLVFLGYGNYERMIADRSAACSNIHLHPAVPHEQVVEVVRGADVGLCMVEKVSLSDYFCLPNKLFEYCFSGVPVIASAFPDITAMVERYQLGICSEGTPDSLRGAIEAFCRRPMPVQVDPATLAPISWGAQEEILRGLYRRILGMTDVSGTVNSAVQEA